jgi:probable F420-dependent oxidoreductase
MPYFGVTIFPTDEAIAPVELARAVEERGLDSLFVTEHTHIPASRRTPWPGGADLPREYWRTHDPFVALAAAAAVTRRIRLGTGVCLVVERDPIQLAKEVASLDVVSGGRFVFGVGAGWNREEMENHGVDYRTRWQLVREKVQAMRAIWTQEAPEFHGELVDFDPIWSWPKPVQPGGPKVLIGAQSKWVYERVADWGDGWMPIALMGGIEEGAAALRRACELASRDFGSLHNTVYGHQADEEKCRKTLAAGFEEITFPLPSAGREKVLPLLDRYAELARKLR